MAKTIEIDVVADVKRAVAGLELVNQRLDSLDSQSERTGTSFGRFTEHVRDLAVAQLAVNALSKGFPDLSFGVDAAATKMTLLAAGLTSVVAAGAPVLALGAGLGAAFGTAGAGVLAFVGLVRPAFTAVSAGVTAAAQAQDAYNAALRSGDGEAANKALAAREAALAGLTPVQRMAADATLSLKDALDAQSDAFSLPVVSAYTRGIETLKGLLPEIVAVANPARDALIGIFDRANEGAKSPAFHEFLTFLAGEVGPTITKLGDIAASFGRVLANVWVDAAPVAQTALDVFSELMRMLADSSAGKGLKQFFTDMQPLVPIVGGLILSVVRAVGDLVKAAEPLAGPVLTAFTALGDALQKLFQSKDFNHFVAELGAAFQLIMPLFDTLQAAVGKVLDTLATQFVAALPPVVTAVGDLAKVFSDVLVGVTPLLAPLAKLASALITGLLPAFGGLALAIKNAAVPALDALTQVMPQLTPAIVQVVQALTPILPMLAQVAIALIPLLPPIVQLAAALITLAVEAITPLLPILTQLVTIFVQDLAPGIQHNTDSVGALSTALTEFSQSPVFALLSGTVVATFQAILGSVLIVSELLTGQFSAAWDSYQKTVTGTSNTIRGAVDQAFTAMGKSMGVSGDMMKKAIADAFTNMVQTAEQKTLALILAVTSIGGKIKTALADAGNYLKEAGSKIIQGLIDGIQAKFQAVKDKLNELTQQLPNWKGPANTDAKLLVGAGQLIMQGLVDGLARGERGVMQQLQGTTARISDAFSGAQGSAATALSGFGVNASVAGSGGGRVYSITVEVPPNADLVAVGAATVQAIDAYENAGGRRS